MGVKLSNEIIPQIPVLYEELKNKSEVARRLNISVASVNKYLTIINAAPIEEKKKTRVKITPELIEKIENAIQNYFWSGAGMIEVRKYLT